MQRTTTYLAWTAVIIALLAWAFVIWFAFTLQSMQTQQLSDTQLSASASSRASQASDLHAELQESANERAQLGTLINVDPTTLADTINQAGTTAGVDLQIQSAAPETETTTDSPTQAFDFSLAAQGSFPGLLYTMQLIEALPVPSSVQNFQLIRAPSTGATTGGAWQLNAGVRVITDTSIPS